MARQRLEEYQRALQLRYNMAATTMLPPRLIHPPLHSTQSVHLPAALPLPPSTPAVPAHIHVKPQTSVEIPTREPDMLASPPRPPGSSSRVCSRLLPDEVESISSNPRNQRPDVSAWLADNILERVTEHLPEKVRPFSVAREPLPYKPFTTHHSISVPLQSASDPIQSISPSITDGASLVPGHAAVKPGTLPQVSVPTGSLSSREDDMERQRRELQQAQRRVLVQREAVVLQQRQHEEKRQRQEVEMKQMRRQKETLQALIHTDAQVSEGTIIALPFLNIER